MPRVAPSVTASAGAGSSAERRRLLGGLLSRASAPEADFLARLIRGSRAGAPAGIVVEAVASAAGIGALVRRAAMLVGEVPAVAKSAGLEGAAGLAIGVLCRAAWQRRASPSWATSST